MSAELPGWDRLRHGGLLLDGSRLATLKHVDLPPLDQLTEYRLRKFSAELPSDNSVRSSFITFVLERVCGFDTKSGAWTRGNKISTTWSRLAVTGETMRPRQLWLGPRGALLPVFVSEDKRIGIGRGRKIVSSALGWLRAGNEHLALVTNGCQWRLIFAGLDYDAWCEWDVDLWFEEGSLSPQVQALRSLLRPDLFMPESEDAAPPLLQAIRDTRKGQAELSEVLGERVREAVEILIRGHGDVLHSLVENPQEYVTSFGVDLTDLAGVSRTEIHADDYKEIFGAEAADVYRAACRIAMRLVVILFAEARELLPRSNPVYHENYGLNGLLDRLEREAVHGAGRMANQHSAWTRILALFRLVREGSHHPDLPVPAYGSELFAPGDASTDVSASDGLSRALSVFEGAIPDSWLEQNRLTDADVYQILTLLTRTRIRIRQGRTSTWVPAPVDFSDLSTEYIGILYEGLLDYELKPAPSDDPVVFLAVGDQPALPLSRLENMDARALKALFESLKTTKASDEAPDDETDMEDTITGDTAAAQDTGPHATSAVGASTPDYAVSNGADYDAVAEAAPQYYIDPRLEHRKRAEDWARSAVLVAGLVPKRKTKETPERRLRFEEQIIQKARQLVSRVVLPGEWYLVRWGGTRKGSGSFYTRPGLAVPTVHRTLRPLAYDPPEAANGSPDHDAPPARWIPKRPEEILALKVCDPACGSGTFPLAALRYLTDALYASLQHHGRIREDGQRTLVGLLSGTNGETHVNGEECIDKELIPCPPNDDSFEARLKAVLRRHVVERCIYAVDLDPLAVELCRLALWIETMDRTLPFGFIDHKIKCGNALIGAWFDQFRHYPAMAWKNREGGDKTHANGVHYAKNARTSAIKTFVREQLKPDLKLFLQGKDLFQEDLLEQARTAHQDALDTLRRIHEMPVHEATERGDIYRRDFLGSDSWRSLKAAMDLWCACWFWPVDEIQHAPLPTSFANPPDETRAIADRIAAQERFFHWELEFPDVFRERSTRENASVETDSSPGKEPADKETTVSWEEKVMGFDAILGNPPWDIAKPVSKEFFSNIDPLYRSYGKQEALRRQSGYFEEHTVIEREWLDYNARFRSQSNYTSHTANPFGDPETSVKSQTRFTITRGSENHHLHDRWRSARNRARGYADARHPFRHQGSADLNLYKLFLEAAHTLLRDNGRLGFVVPSGLYSDNGTSALRNLFLEQCCWEWLFGIENRTSIFPIHKSYKFNPVVIQKSGRTDTIQTTFMRRNLEDWERAEEIAIPYTLTQLDQFSPRSRALLEIQNKRDLEILEKIYANSVLLGDDGPDGWDIRYATEFHMTGDSKLFPPRPQWEAKDYRPDEYSRWLKGDWRPIGELWAEMGIAPSKPTPAEVELEDWLFDTTADPHHREAEARFIHGHLVKPGDVARTEWHLRCAQPLYDKLPIPRADIPEGVIFSREGNAWIKEERIEDVALPLYQGIMIQPFMPSARGWLSGTGLRAKWDYTDSEKLVWNPQYLMSRDVVCQEIRVNSLKIGYREVARSTDARSFIGAILPDFPCGHKVPILYSEHPSKERTAAVLALMNSFVFDWLIRERLGAAALAWYVLKEAALPVEVPMRSFAYLVEKLNLFPNIFAPENANHTTCAKGALLPGERIRLRVMIDAMAVFTFGCDTDDLHHILQHCDLPVSDTMSGVSDRVTFDMRGFWRIDRQHPPELRHTVLTLIAFRDLEQKIRQAGGDQTQGINAFLTQNNGEGWLLPETLCLADYGLGHDDRAKQPQPVASRLGPRFYDWQLTQTTEESWRECHLHARNLLGESDYRQLLENINNPHQQDQKNVPLAKVAEEPATYTSETPDRRQDREAGQSDMFE